MVTAAWYQWKYNWKQWFPTLLPKPFFYVLKSEQGISVVWIYQSCPMSGYYYTTFDDYKPSCNKTGPGSLEETAATYTQTHNHWDTNTVLLDNPLLQLRNFWAFFFHTCSLLRMQIIYLLMPFKTSSPDWVVPDTSYIIIRGLIIEVRWFMSPPFCYQDAYTLVFLLSWSSRRNR